ncbi:zinc-ribbon domain-containing protein [Paracoccus shandongensis]|uniref:zinc-ribbon domain-containing protein n=1 Tax=Paracoccus shandongensis TaxID=2816048 RepID=UPI001A90721E|nr:zinc-ribbon domain-containing protein [Paracoccus shandongensis]
MAEIRLICPGCAAEYRLPDTAIPPEGREVECSACGHVWYATAQPPSLPPAGDPPRPSAPAEDQPRLSRPLPASVLDILRDEVEHERRARAAEGEAAPLPASSALPRVGLDPEWPATTITTAITRHVDPRPVAPVPAPASPAPAPAQPMRTEPAEPLPQAERPLPDQMSSPAPVPASSPARTGYAAGFGLAAMLAAACVALYLLAPALSKQGSLGEGLMQLRGQVDEARLWLQDRVTGPAR